MRLHYLATILTMGAYGAAYAATPITPVGSDNLPRLTATNPGYFRSVNPIGKVVAKSDNYTVLSLDNGSSFHLTGVQKTLTLTLPTDYSDTSFSVSFCNLNNT